MNAITLAFIKAGYRQAPKFIKRFDGWSATLSYKTRMSLRNQGYPV